MISAKDISNRLAITFLAYQLSHPKENDEIRACAKTLDRILEWSGKQEESP